MWGFAVGVVLAVLQAGALPFLGVFSSSPRCRAGEDACIIGAVLQPLNGVVFVGEGLMQAIKPSFASPPACSSPRAPC